MKNILILLGSMFLLVGCVESVAVLSTGAGAANGKLVQSSINTGISYGIKKQTGKSPMGHALAYNDKKKLKVINDSCSSFSNKKNLDFCKKLKERIAASQKDFKKSESSYNSKIEITKSLQSSIDQKFKIKYLD